MSSKATQPLGAQLLSCSPPGHIVDLVDRARRQWLKNDEVLDLLLNHKAYGFKVSTKAPITPPGGSLFLFNRNTVRYFRKDGHDWRKKVDGKSVRETHEKLKVGGAITLNCYYAHSVMDDLQRRSYWLLEGDKGLVLVHYLATSSVRSTRRRLLTNNSSVSPAPDAPALSTVFSSGDPLCKAATRHTCLQDRHPQVPQLSPFAMANHTVTSYQPYPPTFRRNQTYSQSCHSMDHTVLQAQRFGRMDCYSPSSSTSNYVGSLPPSPSSCSPPLAGQLNNLHMHKMDSVRSSQTLLSLSPSSSQSQLEPCYSEQPATPADTMFRPRVADGRSLFCFHPAAPAHPQQPTNLRTACSYSEAGETLVSGHHEEDPLQAFDAILFDTSSAQDFQQDFLICDQEGGHCVDVQPSSARTSMTGASVTTGAATCAYPSHQNALPESMMMSTFHPAQHKPMHVEPASAALPANRWHSQHQESCVQTFSAYPPLCRTSTMGQSMLQEYDVQYASVQRQSSNLMHQLMSYDEGPLLLGGF